MKRQSTIRHQLRKTLAAIAVILAAVITGCSNNSGTSENQGSNGVTASRDEHSDGEGRGEHGRGEHDREGRGEHDRDGDNHHGEEGEESGTELALTESYDKVRNGAQLILAYDAYDAESNSFKGTVENTTKKTLERVRVEVHLSNGKELGPTTPADLEGFSQINSPSPAGVLAAVPLVINRVLFWARFSGHSCSSRHRSSPITKIRQGEVCSIPFFFPFSQ